MKNVVNPSRMLRMLWWIAGYRRQSLLEEAVQAAWPYSPLYGQVALPPLATTQVKLVMRVYRDPAGPGYPLGLEKMSDDMRDLAGDNG